VLNRCQQAILDELAQCVATWCDSEVSRLAKGVFHLSVFSCLLPEESECFILALSAFWWEMEVYPACYSWYSQFHLIPTFGRQLHPIWGFMANLCSIEDAKQVVYAAYRFY
jgi:hypothetical protein